MKGWIMNSSLVAAVALVAVLIPNMIVGAHTGSVTDPDDVPGKLDIKRVTTGHGSISLSLVFWDPPRLRHFDDGDRAGWTLDTRDDGKIDPNIQVRAVKRTRQDRNVLRCIVLRIESGDRIGSVRGNLEGAKVDCEIPRRILRSFFEAFQGFSTFNGNHDLSPAAVH
jgi:hypothetical protein